MKTKNTKSTKGSGVTPLRIALTALLLLAVSCLFFVLIKGVSNSKISQKMTTQAAFTITSSLSDDQYNNYTNFEIGTAEGLSTFFTMIFTRHDFSGKNVSLTSNINFNSNAVYPNDVELKNSVFNGNFDGRNNTISNIKTSCGESERREPKKAWYYYYYAMFPSLGSNAVISNLKVQNIIGGTDKTNFNGGTHSSVYYRRYYKGGINYAADSGAQIINCIVDGADENVAYPFSNSASVSNCLIISANNASFGTTNQSCVTYTSSNTYTTTSALNNQYWIIPDSGNSWNGGRPMLRSFIINWKDITINTNFSDMGSLVINSTNMGSGTIKLPQDYTINTTFPNTSQSLTIAGNEIIASPLSDNTQFVNWSKDGDIITANFKYKPVLVNINVVNENKEAISIVNYDLNSTLNQVAYTSTNGKYDIGVEISISNIALTDNKYYLSKVYYETAGNQSEITKKDGVYSHTVENTATIYIEVKLKSYGLVLN